MRLKKVKGAEETVISSHYYIDSQIISKGEYHRAFNNDNPIQIEIGTGKGNFIINKATQNPHINYIGIEKYASVLVRAMQKLEPLNLSNLKIMMLDASIIDEVFDKEIDTLFLNFSDPWPKKRHEHRRLTNPIFLRKYDNIFKEKAHIIMKTDNRKLFEYSIKSFVNYGYKIEDISLDLYSDNDESNIPTEYEQKFHNKGNVIYRVEVIK